ncbi:MAG: hypothetical protein JNM45_06965 [Rhizobiales bacterium]|nr:hypothetical protein [Hyphomicrobiales bacterium]
MARTGDGLAFTWIRQTRIDGDSWDLAEVPLGETSEAYRVWFLDGDRLCRTIDVGTAECLYSTAEMTRDFTVTPQRVTVRVAQLSSAVGAGITTERTFNV